MLTMRTLAIGDAVTDLPNHFRVGSDCVVLIEKWDSVALPP
jgi:hypothetical protein